MRHRPGWLALLAVVACAPGARSQSLGDETTLPPGYGTLSQDQIAITMGAENLEVRILPLEEPLLVLLAPDSYAALHQLRASRQAQIDSAASRHGVADPGVVMVSFFGRAPGVQYDPQNLVLYIRSQLYRPFAILPFTTNFDSRRLDVRQSAIGLFLFEEPIPVFEGFQVGYGGEVTDAWLNKISRLQRERTRVQGRAQATSRDTSGAASE